MVTDIDHDVIKAKLVTVLQGNSAIFETPPTDPNKFRILEKGSPDLGKIQALPMPSLFVISDERTIDVNEREAPVSSGVELGSKITFEYTVIFVAQANTSERVEEKLDDFEKEIKETLRENTQLGNVGAVTTNRVVHGSKILRVETLDPTILGHQQQGRLLQLQLWKHIT